MNKKNILLIAYDFPGILSPESIQVQRRAINLANNGHKVYVLTSHENPKYEFIDNNLIDNNDNLTIIRTKKPTFERTLNVFFKLYDIADRKYWWKYYAVILAKSLVEKYNINLLYSNSHPFVDHIVGLEVKKSYPEIFWITHFSDPWTLNSYKVYKTKVQKSMNERLENEILSLSNRITVTSELTKELYIKYFTFLKNKIFVIPHMFDSRLYLNNEKSDSKKIKIIHTGNIYGLRTIKYLLEVLNEENYNNIEFEFYGKVKKDEEYLIEKYKLNSKVKSYSQVSYKKSIEIMSKADFLLVVDAPLEFSPFFPSKLVDYIGSRKKIFALTPRKSSTEEVLKFTNNDNFIASPTSKEEIKLILKQINSLDFKEYKEKNIDYFSMNNYNLLKNIFEI